MQLLKDVRKLETNWRKNFKKIKHKKLRYFRNAEVMLKRAIDTQKNLYSGYIVLNQSCKSKMKKKLTTNKASPHENFSL